MFSLDRSRFRLIRQRLMHTPSLLVILSCLGVFQILGSTIAVNLTAGIPIHSYAPEWTVQFPSTGSTFTFPAQAEDQAACPTASGLVIPMSGITTLEFNIMAPSGWKFSISPSGLAYALGYSFNLSGWGLPDSTPSGAQVSLLDVSGTSPPWLMNTVNDDLGTTILSGFSEASSSSYQFTGMRVTMPVTSMPSSGLIALDFADIGLTSRNLYGTTDPGPAMGLIAVPESNTAITVLLGALILLQHRRSSHKIPPQAPRSGS